MLTQDQKTKIEYIVQGKIVARDAFTAFEITQALRRSDQTAIHNDVRSFVHNYMEAVLDAKLYERDEFYEHPTEGWTAQRYSAVSVASVNGDGGIIDDTPALSPEFLKAAGAITFVDRQTVAFACCG